MAKSLADAVVAELPPGPVVEAELPAYVQALRQQLGYLQEAQIAKILRAYVIAAWAHAGQTRQSGEPYITHPVAAARILAELHLDPETIVAAILHDTLEDTLYSREALTAEFGATVAELVDGVTKLDKVHFRSRQEADAESFRKMLLAMSRDLRVILIKLADRLHNMRTLGAKASASRGRIARETLEIYAPIAQRLGMNRFKSELQELSFQALYPLRYRVISSRIRSELGSRSENLALIERNLSDRLAREALPVTVSGRIKSAWSIYSKMRSEHKRFAQLLDLYGFRIITDTIGHCYAALGVAHALYKPVDRRFKDFIAIPKANGYQSLHTVLLGPISTPIEVQIRTAEMEEVAEGGVAAHWAYKNDIGGPIVINGAQLRVRKWLSSLVDNQAGTHSPTEFIENVKIDLFPDEVHLFTPRGDILALPKDATPLDFAFAVHTHVGMHAVAARIDGRLSSLRAHLESGQQVEIITAPSAVPNPSWLGAVVTGKARTSIRQYLKHLQHEDAVDFGHRMLDRALSVYDSSLDAISLPVLEGYLGEQRFARMEDLLSAIALGNRPPNDVAVALLVAAGHCINETAEAVEAQRRYEKIRINGSERGILSFGSCCHPLPGDDIIGHISPGQGIVVHRQLCPEVKALRAMPERSIEIDWSRKVQGKFRAELRVEVMNRPGVLARVAAAIAAADSNIENIEYAERDSASATMLFTLELSDGQHLVEVMRRIRRTGMVNGVYRHPV